MAKITQDMIIADILKIDTGLVPILLRSGLHCLGCPSAQGETLEEAAIIHAIDVDALVEEMNLYLSQQG